MKVYRIIVIVVAIILGISFTTLLFFGPATQAAIKEPVTEEYYDMLKEKALNGYFAYIRLNSILYPIYIK